VGSVFLLPTVPSMVGNKNTLPTLHKILNLIALLRKLGDVIGRLKANDDDDDDESF
jgi:hypothetical protein